MDPEVDADLFVAAQDFDQTWKNYFTASKASINGQQATVQVLLKGRNGFDRKLRVALRRDDGVWKIDKREGQLVEKCWRVRLNSLLLERGG